MVFENNQCTEKIFGVPARYLLAKVSDLNQPGYRSRVKEKLKRECKTLERNGVGKFSLFKITTNHISLSRHLDEFLGCRQNLAKNLLMD